VNSLCRRCFWMNRLRHDKIGEGHELPRRRHSVCLAGSRATIRQPCSRKKLVSPGNELQAGNDVNTDNKMYRIEEAD
jgi:hypothetical protein